MPTYDFKCDRCNRVSNKGTKKEFPCDCGGTLGLVSEPDSEWEFKCRECDKLEKRIIRWIDRDNQICGCGGKMNMQIVFSGIGFICKWKTPYKPGHNAKEDRKRAFNSQVERKKLPDNYADLK